MVTRRRVDAECVATSRTTGRWRPFLSLALLCLGGVAGVPGCRRPADATGSPPLELPVVNRESHVAATRSALQLVQVYLRAVELRRPTLARQCIDNLIDLADAASIERAAGRHKQIRAFVGDDLVRGFVENWCASLAYYAEGFRLDEMTGVYTAPDESAARVHVRASAKGRENRVRADCVRLPDGRWAIARLELDPRRSTVSSQPAGG